MFNSLVIELGASFVWSVLNTKCPVREAFRAMSTVALSLISPTNITSGSCLRKDLNADSKVKFIASLT